MVAVLQVPAKPRGLDAALDVAATIRIMRSAIGVVLSDKLRPHRDHLMLDRRRHPRVSTTSATPYEATHDLEEPLPEGGIGIRIRRARVRLLTELFHPEQSTHEFTVVLHVLVLLDHPPPVTVTYSNETVANPTTILNRPTATELENRRSDRLRSTRRLHDVSDSPILDRAAVKGRRANPGVLGQRPVRRPTERDRELSRKALDGLVLLLFLDLHHTVHLHLDDVSEVETITTQIIHDREIPRHVHSRIHRLERKELGTDRELAKPLHFLELCTMRPRLREGIDVLYPLPFSTSEVLPVLNAPFDELERVITRRGFVDRVDRRGEIRKIIRHRPIKRVLRLAKRTPVHVHEARSAHESDALPRIIVVQVTPSPKELLRRVVMNTLPRKELLDEHPREIKLTLEIVVKPREIRLEGLVDLQRVVFPHLSPFFAARKTDNGEI